MLKKTLNDRSLGSLKPAPKGKRYVVWDSVLPNFGIRVTDSGHKTFFVMRRLHGRLRRWCVGQYPAVKIENARKTARDFLEDIVGGTDPRIKRERLRRQEEQRHKDVFLVVAEEFIKKHVSKLRRGKECEAVIRRELCSRWGKLPISEITRRDVVMMLEAVIERGHVYAAHHALSYTRKLFNWAVARDIYGLEHSPCDRIKPSELIGKKLARQRILNDDEVRMIHRGSLELGYPFGHLVRLLLLTGQRLREVGEMRWSEIDLDSKIWTLPASRMKSDAAHVVPLCPESIAVLNTIQRCSGGDFVLTTTGGKRPISGFSKAKRNLDHQIIKNLKENWSEGEGFGEEPKITPWRFHDIRRTVRTHLSALPVQDIVRELVISHSKKGLHKVYDQWAYMEEKRNALQLWEFRLAKIIANQSNIILLNSNPAGAKASEVSDKRRTRKAG